jgi:hypothetical protein
MTFDELAEIVAEVNPDAIVADGLEDAAIGYTMNHHSAPVVVYDYDYDKCVAVLVKRDGMSEEEADEFLGFNTLGAYVGLNGPVYIKVLR